jgi:hypothetical protein
LKLSTTFTLKTFKPSVTTDTVIEDGKVTSNNAQVGGIKGLELDVKSGALGGLSDNLKLRAEVPIRIQEKQSFGPYGFPYTLGFRPKFIIETAFSAKNSTLTAHGEWAIDAKHIGAVVGNVAQTFSPVALETKKSIVDSLDGISVGVSGLVFAFQFQFRVGIGSPLFSFGPYVSITASYGLTRGTSIDLVVCKGGTFDLTIGTGINFEADHPKITELMGNKWGTAPKFVQTFVEAKKSVIHRESIEPDVPLCDATLK